MKYSTPESSTKRTVLGLGLAGALALSGCSEAPRHTDAHKQNTDPVPMVTCMPQAKSIGSLLLSSAQRKLLIAGTRPPDVDFGMLTAGTPYHEADIVSFRLTQRADTSSITDVSKLARELDQIVAPQRHQDALVIVVKKGMDAGLMRVEAGISNGCVPVTQQPAPTEMV